jgi:hypothetical protein
MSEGGGMSSSQSFLARLSAEEASEGGGGGGASNTASAGNIFEIDSSITGPGEGTTGGLNLDWSGIMSKDFKSLLEESSPMLNAIFFKININGGALLPTIDYFANVRNIQPFNFLAIKPVTLFGMSQ